MLKHYLKTAGRNLARNKGISFINIAGLAIGMACCILIMLWVEDELSFDQFHEKADQLYLVVAWTDYGAKRDLTSNTPPALGPALMDEYPEIVAATRHNGGSSMALRYGDKAFMERCHAADQSFLEMFSFPLLKGEVASALTEPHSMVITEDMADKYFGEEEPLGKVIEVDGRYQFTVTGVLKNIPHNSYLQFDILIPFPTLAELWDDPTYPQAWTNWNLYTYIQLQGGASYQEVQEKVSNRVNESYPESHSSLFLSPFSDLYLHGFGPVSGRFPLVVMLSIIGLFVLFIACLNFMNITTARSAARAREIGLRKVAGAHRKDIIVQFYSESLLLALISLLVALALVEVALPIFNNLVGRSLSLELVGNPWWILALLSVALLTGLVAGSYPALYMAAFKPAKIFAGIMSSGPRRSVFIKSFVVFQFAASVVLVIATMVIQRQLEYAQTRDLGFDRTNLAYIHLKGDAKNRHEMIKDELLRHPDILHVSATSRVPTGVWDNGSKWEWPDRPVTVDPLVTYFGADVDFLETFGAEMARGEYYSKDRPGVSSVTSGDAIINEAFAKIIGVENPVGTQIHNYGHDFTIIGVVKDFNFKPFYWRIGPMLLYQKTFSETSSDRYNFLFARLRPGSPEPALDHIRSVWEKSSDGLPLVLRFLEDDYDLMYVGEERFGTILKYSAALMIIVACLGLFGLATFAAEQRTREIGVRKVLGASVPGIVRLLCWQILTPVLLANLIAWVVSYLVVTSWLLSSFAYRAGIGWQPFVLASSLTIAVALVSVSYQAIRAAVANPVASLRRE